MAIDFRNERQQVHALLEQLPPAKLGAVRSLLEFLLDDDNPNEELTEEDRQALRVGLDSSEKRRTVSMEELLADFGLTLAEFEAMVN